MVPRYAQKNRNDIETSVLDRLASCRAENIISSMYQGHVCKKAKFFFCFSRAQFVLLCTCTRIVHTPSAYKDFLYCVENLADVVRVFSANLNQKSHKYIHRHIGRQRGPQLGQPKIFQPRYMLNSFA